MSIIDDFKAINKALKGDDWWQPRGKEEPSPLALVHTPAKEQLWFEEWHEIQDEVFADVEGT